MDSNGHPYHDQSEKPPERKASEGAVIAFLNQSLDARANAIRQLQDREVYLLALQQDAMNENLTLQAVLGQVRDENLLLRKRLGLSEEEPIVADANNVIDAVIEDIGT